MKRIVVITYLLAIQFDCFSQRQEYGVSGGVMNYIGDLSPGVSMSEFKPSFGVFYRDNIKDFFAMRYSLNYGTVAGTDQNWQFNRRRNLHFYSDIYEVSSIAEINFVKFGWSKFVQPATFFFGVGVSMFKFEPKATYRSGEVLLRQYGTEGQYMRHSRTYLPVTWAIPVGVGFKLHLSEKMVLALESFWRRTGTDYLDDMSNGLYTTDDKGLPRYTGYPDKVDMSKFNQMPHLDQTMTTAQTRQLAIELSDRSSEGITDPAIGFAGKQRGNPLNKDWFITIGGTLSYRIVKVTCNKGSF